MSLLMVGTSVGAIAGIIHATYVYRVCVDSGLSDSCSPVRATYYATWTFGLWVLSGSYLLVLWLAAVILYGVSRLFARRMSQ